MIEQEKPVGRFKALIFLDGRSDAFPLKVTGLVPWPGVLRERKTPTVMIWQARIGNQPDVYNPLEIATEKIIMHTLQKLDPPAEIE